MTVYSNFMASIGAMSEKGHQIFMKYLDSFDRRPNWEDVKEEMSPMLKNFLRLADKDDGEG